MCQRIEGAAIMRRTGWILFQATLAFSPAPGRVFFKTQR